MGLFLYFRPELIISFNTNRTLFFDLAKLEVRLLNNLEGLYDTPGSPGDTAFSVEPSSLLHYSSTKP